MSAPVERLSSCIHTDGEYWLHTLFVADIMSSPRSHRMDEKIAYAKAGRHGNIDIFVQNLAGGATKRLTTHAGYDRQPTWSPDGSKIAFMSSRSGKGQIWTMNAATGGSQTADHAHDHGREVPGVVALERRLREDNGPGAAQRAGAVLMPTCCPAPSARCRSRARRW